MKNLFKKSYSSVIIHIASWLVYAVSVYLANKLKFPNARFVDVIFFLIPFVISFYASLFCIKQYASKGWLWGVFSFLFVFVIIATPGYIYIYYFLPRNGVIVFTNKIFKDFLFGAVFGYIKIYGFALIYFLAKEAIRKEKQLRLLQEQNAKSEQEKIQKELENAILKQNELNIQSEKLQMEYAFLRAQINPHFLHNTLNVLFSQALNVSQELADNILKLSKIMRYSMESLEYGNGAVSIEKELDHLQTLLDVHKLRFGADQVIYFSIEGKESGQQLPPLSIITVVENAFKYGDLTDRQHPLLIKVVLKPTEIYFFCKNKKKNGGMQMPSTSIGITNLSKRLDAAFKDRYQLTVNNESDFYTFELKVLQN